ncbi:A-agglutinin anchorage subunit-like [Rhagoletis pomonella]|uniref:A-agglutinin anchorage subunit-like n=1 Tax=Rhagoletis pomonella TaxID=28610 RepID=UPI001780DACB|nr:A-agglutinin anchorage subunit-like [Rhagoletis pomonella]
MHLIKISDDFHVEVRVLQTKLNEKDADVSSLIAEIKSLRSIVDNSAGSLHGTNVTAAHAEQCLPTPTETPSSAPSTKCTVSNAALPPNGSAKRMALYTNVTYAAAAGTNSIKANVNSSVMTAAGAVVDADVDVNSLNADIDVVPDAGSEPAVFSGSNGWKTVPHKTKTPKRKQVVSPMSLVDQVVLTQQQSTSLATSTVTTVSAALTTTTSTTPSARTAVSQRSSPTPAQTSPSQASQRSSPMSLVDQVVLTQQKSTSLATSTVTTVSAALTTTTSTTPSARTAVSQRSSPTPAQTSPSQATQRSAS